MKFLLSIVMSVAVMPDSRLDETALVNDADADKILAANQSGHFLNNCMVVFVR